MVIFVSKCYGAMACIPGRPPVQDLLISINNDASGPIFMKDFLQSDPFPTFKSGKADPSHHKSCLSFLFCCFEWGVFAATQKYLAMVKSWTRLAYCGWSSVHFHPVFCYSFVLATISHYKEFLMVILTIYEHIY